MINKKLLITYLKVQRREYEKQVAVLQKELDSCLVRNNRQVYSVKQFMCDSMMNVVRVYTDLIEKVENGEFDDEKKNMQIANSLPTDSLPPYYGFNQAEKSIKPLNDIIASITEEEYNEDFINEMKRIEQEKSEKF